MLTLYIYIKWPYTHPAHCDRPSGRTWEGVCVWLHHVDRKRVTHTEIQTPICTVATPKDHNLKKINRRENFKDLYTFTKFAFKFGEIRGCW